MTEYTPITLNQGLNDVTYMDDGRITDVKWDVPIYFLRGNNYENIGSINDIRGRRNFNGITDANSVLIGTLDDFISGDLRGTLFIRNSEEENEEEKRTPPKFGGGKSRKSRKSRKSSNKKRKQRKTKRTKK